MELDELFDLAMLNDIHPALLHSQATEIIVKFEEATGIPRPTLIEYWIRGWVLSSRESESLVTDLIEEGYVPTSGTILHSIDNLHFRTARKLLQHAPDATFISWLSKEQGAFLLQNGVDPSRLVLTPYLESVAAVYAMVVGAHAPCNCLRVLPVDVFKLLRSYLVM